MRTRIKIACALLAFAATSGIAGAGSANATNYGKADLKKMARDAQTSEEHRVLASYYRMRQQQFADQAHDEIVWFARRSLNVSLPAAKYPTPLDSSRNRYEYFNYETQRMSRQAAHYESLSANTAQ
jgi:hypothetical protein